MSRTHYFYFRLTVKELETLIEAHQMDFDALILDSLGNELNPQQEKLLDELAAVIVQPILVDLRFDDFYPDPSLENEQRAFFESCRSSLCLENLPYFQTNPFQVTYLQLFLHRVSEVLIDEGGVSALKFKKTYLEELNHFKNIDCLITDVLPIVQEVKSSKPVHPIDFVIRDVYQELERLSLQNKIFMVTELIESQSEKLQKLFSVMKLEKLDSGTLLKRSTLIPKDFGDYLERLKFFLKKIS